MGLFQKQHEEAKPVGLLERLGELAQERVEAAKRVDDAIVEIEAAIEELLAADDAFFAEVRSSGASDHGTGGHLRRVLRTLLMGQMQIAAPKFVRHLGIPFLPARAQGSIRDAVQRTSANNLADLAPRQETVA
ncbi:hypothetical protein [Sphingopyxis sp. P8]|uniref:hypothetical protein n=1 Tax=Sphingopyxis sp. P8 TaxID=2763256 RepID=UPI001D0ABCA8|nr:hypothetical protein [Sphingopyxis sp. P8]